MPTIQRGSITSERSSLYIRSVPMFPEPMTAAAGRLRVVCIRDVVEAAASTLVIGVN